MRKKLLFTILALTITFMAHSQEVIAFGSASKSPEATLNNVSWIAGHWRGEAFGGITEEMWSPPLGESMMFVFKLVHNNKVSFYEIGHIKEVGGTLLLQLKHFHGDLKGWEEKDETVDFKLVKIEGNRIYFDEFTFEKISDAEMNIYVLIEEKDKPSEVVKFNYKRVN